MNVFRRKRNAPVAQSLPATPDSIATRIAAGGNSIVERATSIYRKNPKAVGGVALLASALLLNRLRSRIH